MERDIVQLAQGVYVQARGKRGSSEFAVYSFDNCKESDTNFCPSKRI